MSIYPIINYSQKNAGKITITTLLLCFLVLAVFVVADTQYRGVSASDTATTSVTVINSPPVWVDGPREDPDSGSSTPVNEGSSVVWKATANDPNESVEEEGNDYWLLICEGSPDGVDEEDFTTYDGTNDPECPGDQWAISGRTGDGVEAEASYLVPGGREADEVNEWYAALCDADSVTPRCNAYYEDGLRIGPDENSEVDDEGSSPFYVNYRPTFTSLTAPGGTDPGDDGTWTTIASDPNEELSTSTVRLFMCRNDEFDEVNQECQGGEENTYGSSTLVESDPSVTYTLKNPKPNGEYDAYGFVVDAYGLTAPTTSTWDETRRQGSNRELEVNNVAPVLETSSVDFYDVGAGSSGGPFGLSNSEGLTEGFKIEFNTSDDNSCQTKEGDPEMTEVAVSFYRASGTECVTDDDYDSNNCYPSAVSADNFEGEGGWDLVCTRDQDSCGGTGHKTVEWECEFPLWFNADPTDGDSPFSDDDWYVSMTVTDTDGATGERLQSDGNVELTSLMAFRLDQNAINYQALDVGVASDLNAPTPILSIGNTGVDQNLIGTPMCPGFDLGATNYGCTDYSGDVVPEDTIPARFQRFGAVDGDYSSGTELADSHLDESEELHEVNVPKTTDPLSPGVGTIGWGMEIPEEIVTAADYQGQNTFSGVISGSENWGVGN